MQKQTVQQLLFQNLVSQDVIVKRTDVQITSDARLSPNDDRLASHPTVSRFENNIKPKMLEALRGRLVTTGVERLRMNTAD